MSYDIFFILGCQRSGTTLMRLILDSHNSIQCFDETRSYDILKDYESFPQLIQNYKQIKLFGFKTLGYTEQMNYPFLSEPVRNTTITNQWNSKKMLFLYRHAFDVISSMKKYIQKNKKTWLENWIMPTIEFWKQKIPEFDKEFKDELNYANTSTNKHVSYAALYWKIKTRSMIEYQSKKFQIIKIKYENLVSAPEAELRKITNFLNVDWQDSLLHHNTIIHDEINEQGLTVGMNDPYKPIHSNSIGLSKKFLSNEEKQDIMHIAGDLLFTLGYVGINQTC